MTSPNHRLSLEEVLDVFFYSSEKPSPDIALRACKAHPEYRADILEFAALWSAYDAAPEPLQDTKLSQVSHEDVSLLQSFLLNRLHELSDAPVSESDETAARTAVGALAGGRLKRAAEAIGLGGSAILLTKVLTKRIPEVPTKVLNDLAEYLNVNVRALLQCLGLQLAGSMRYKAADKPIGPVTETWESAVLSLPVSDTEKSRLLALQAKE